MAGTLWERLWTDHRVAVRGDGRDLIYVDRILSHEMHAPTVFQRLKRSGRSIRRPDLVFQTVDHSVSTFREGGGPPNAAASIARSVPFLEATRAGCKEHGIHIFDDGMNEQGITHVIAPELGLALPGSSYACPDSHAATVGALGVLALGIGTSELEHALVTQTLSLRRPKTMRLVLAGRPGPGTTAKDLILYAISVCGVDSAREHAVEFQGPTIEALDMEGRMTVCNMAIEMGARTALIAPDDTTFEWLTGRPFAPAGTAWHAALGHWRKLSSSPDAIFDKEVEINVGGLSPQVTWGVSPAQVVAIDGRVPTPPDGSSPAATALDYMGLQPGEPLEGISIDRVFIGSCTNARLRDLEEAAAILRGRRIAPGVKAVVSPGSTSVRREAEAKGLDKVFRDAGFYWGAAACAMCAGGAGDGADPGDRCLSTTSRNFQHRQGPNVRTHLASPSTVAASAVTGRITDPRKLSRAAE